MASTLHQCLKYYRDREEKINSDVKPFAKAESHFVDARFFEEGAPFKEAMPAFISSTGKRSDEDTYVKTNIGTNDNACLLYTSPSPRDGLLSRMPSSA